MPYRQNDRGYGSSYSPVDSGGSNEDATTSDAACNDEDQMSGPNEAMAGENFCTATNVWSIRFGDL